MKRFNYSLQINMSFARPGAGWERRKREGQRARRLDIRTSGCLFLSASRETGGEGREGFNANASPETPQAKRVVVVLVAVMFEHPCNVIIWSKPGDELICVGYAGFAQSRR
ncbi:hypothetical protein CLAIMM_01349 isoform 3 [Cladophialophora immunda]|nr:hypothetical protein CLAIMM_01349 isoform 1 [Cladophialophora immunda]OQU95098.1 hypothetical protein CLAIMM_01349 isoform 3 [Cladophialophora immunda]